jgi:hypothetical protein
VLLILSLYHSNQRKISKRFYKLRGFIFNDFKLMKIVNVPIRNPLLRGRFELEPL